MAGEPSIPAAGDVVGGRYRIDAVIGEGGTAVVLAATTVATGERVAIKVLREQYASSPDLRARHLREARALAALRSPHVARVIDVGAFPSGATFLVLEHLDGLDLHGVLGQLGPFEPRMAVALLLQACDGVDLAHRAGIWHRDLKPSNLFVVRADDGLACVKLLDFGLAKLTVEGVSTVTARGDVMGSPSYMAPEQICGLEQAAASADIWSLGVTLYELLTDAMPFEGATPTRIANAILNERPVPLEARRKDLDPALVEIVMRCMAKEPAERPRSVRALAEALRPLAAPAVRFVTLCGGGDAPVKRDRTRRMRPPSPPPEPTYGGLLPIAAAPPSVRIQVPARDADDEASAQATLVRFDPFRNPEPESAPTRARGEVTEMRPSLARHPKGSGVFVWGALIALTVFGTVLLVAFVVLRASR